MPKVRAYTTDPRAGSPQGGWVEPIEVDSITPQQLADDRYMDNLARMELDRREIKTNLPVTPEEQKALQAGYDKFQQQTVAEHPGTPTIPVKTTRQQPLVPGSTTMANVPTVEQRLPQPVPVEQPPLPYPGIVGEGNRGFWTNLGGELKNMTLAPLTMMYPPAAALAAANMARGTGGTLASLSRGEWPSEQDIQATPFGPSVVQYYLDKPGLAGRLAPNVALAAITGLASSPAGMGVARGGFSGVANYVPGSSRFVAPMRDLGQAAGMAAGIPFGWHGAYFGGKVGAATGGLAGNVMGRAAAGVSGAIAGAEGLPWFPKSPSLPGGSVPPTPFHTTPPAMTVESSPLYGPNYPELGPGWRPPTAPAPSVGPALGPPIPRPGTPSIYQPVKAPPPAAPPPVPPGVQQPLPPMLPVGKMETLSSRDVFPSTPLGAAAPSPPASLPVAAPVQAPPITPPPPPVEPPKPTPRTYKRPEPPMGPTTPPPKPPPERPPTPDELAEADRLRKGVEARAPESEPISMDKLKEFAHLYRGGFTIGMLQDKLKVTGEVATAAVKQGIKEGHIANKGGKYVEVSGEAPKPIPETPTPAKSTGTPEQRLRLTELDLKDDLTTAEWREYAALEKEGVLAYETEAEIAAAKAQIEAAKKSTGAGEKKGASADVGEVTPKKGRRKK